jgi:hypothetical protein
LILQADDQGRHHGDAADIRVACFPKVLHLYSVEDVEQALSELAIQKMVLRYEVRDEPFVQLLGWWAWQSQNRRAYRSRFPAPNGWMDCIYGTIGAPETYERCLEINAAKRCDSPQIAANSGDTPQVAADFGLARAGLRAGALQSEPSPTQSEPSPTQSKPVLPSSSQSEREGHAANGGESPQNAAEIVPSPVTEPSGSAKRSHKKRSGDAGFDRFWAEYPREEQKARALANWRSINPTEEKAAEIMAGLSRWKASRGWTDEGGRYVVYARKFLAEQYWTIPPPGGSNGTGKPGAGQRAPQAHTSGESEPSELAGLRPVHTVGAEED